MDRSGSSVHGSFSIHFLKFDFLNFRGREAGLIPKCPQETAAGSVQGQVSDNPAILCGRNAVT